MSAVRKGTLRNVYRTTHYSGSPRPSGRPLLDENRDSIIGKVPEDDLVKLSRIHAGSVGLRGPWGASEGAEKRPNRAI